VFSGNSAALPRCAMIVGSETPMLRILLNAAAATSQLALRRL
jgi:hypothetical protein